MANHWSQDAEEFGRTQLTAREALHIWNRPASDNPSDAELASQIAAQSFLSKQLDANRANAQLSTGPRTPQGLLRSSLNAQKHGLTGTSRLLAGEDAALYEQHCQHYRDTWQPVGAEELMLVADLADTRWRILRVPRLEAALYAKGRMQFAEAMQDFDLALQADLVEIETHLHYEKPLRNLHLQEGRLRRTYDKLTAQLIAEQSRRKQGEAEARELQQQQQQQQQQAAEAAGQSSTSASANSEQTTNPGFVFTDLPAASLTPASPQLTSTGSDVIAASKNRVHNQN